MHQILNDPIDVLVEFHGKSIRPRRIRWEKQLYDMQRVNLVHTAREGRKYIYYFSVSDNTNFMKLRLDTETLEWRIVELYTE